VRVTVVGAGRVGLVVAAGLGSVGHHVALLDVDEERVDAVRHGRLPFFEPGLGALLERAAELRATTDAREALDRSEVVLLAVPTPRGVQGRHDLSALDAAVSALLVHLHGPVVVAVKSTVPPGTCEAVERRLRERVPGAAVVCNPEFLREGSAVGDFLRPARVVLGAASTVAVDVMRRLYGPLMLRTDRVQVCDRRSAELAKASANAMLATRVSFMNELAALCEAAGADIEAIRRVLGSDPRIGPAYLYPSLGWGGSCLPKDVDGLLALAADHGVPLRVVQGAADANTAQRDAVLVRLRDGLGGLRGRRVAVWGLAFKADTDDVRDSVALHAVRGLLDAGAQVAAHDPRALDAARAALGEGPRWCESPWEALAGADALLLCTEWHEYRAPSFERVAALLDGDLVVDGRNLWDPTAVADAGLRYSGIGRST
jgi:UDPglucose 6-dehydrogenase